MKFGRFARVSALLVPLAGIAPVTLIGCGSGPETGAKIPLESQSEEKERSDAMERYSKELKAKKSAPATKPR